MTGVVPDGSLTIAPRLGVLRHDAPATPADFQVRVKDQQGLLVRDQEVVVAIEDVKLAAAFVLSSGAAKMRVPFTTGHATLRTGADGEIFFQLSLAPSQESLLPDYGTVTFSVSTRLGESQGGPELVARFLVQVAEQRS